MAWFFKNPADALEFFTAAAAGGETWYSWVADHLPGLLPPPFNATDLQLPQNSGFQLPESSQAPLGMAAMQFATSMADVASAQDAAAIALPAFTFAAQPVISGTPGADVFPLDYAALVAAAVPAPTVAEISGYSAAQGDVIDVSAVLRGSYAALTAESAQLRVSESANAAFATLDFNVGTAQTPHWVALAKLDGVQAGDAVSVVLDAAHTITLHSTLLA